ncbi:2-amino-4-hydroxy-6-hydroxymethyldihydropteridine diphosphokinase [Qipengyuania sp. 6B39]|uniref:2-amino-4-hydroxy-6- hydroxymethyldihydropteridine diphosphokinase n=1 Tax=Qipengyuania proteolytica TaxID=2867239 RepID=UPI001C8A04B4|nr:2-amino-4-hydroxy-6-hydroxymethyldihydropteridine diphosphokinase [Qipengyuania proteolytica]MBX7497111.1 2-amino-4-hydroxy-6-hydroxymethyldihydropteridine diphosphokinase [Qipengyuania proteolytica]
MTEASKQRYLIAVGSNMRVPGIGGPRHVVEAAVAALATESLDVLAASPVIDSAPVGPSRRRYANAAVVVETLRDPPALLGVLQAIEHAFGRKRQGAPWRARQLDLDIVLWSGGFWLGSGLTVPHPRFRERPFVLVPAAQVAPNWRDPASSLTLRQLAARVS